ncbi:MAG: hypothetical protein ABSG53_01690 [Thermoguttaceae bacterium]|jgi:hypothetical protein
MELVEFVGGYLADKALGRFCSLFKTNVIDRWSKRRAEEFDQTFCAQVGENHATEDLNDALDQIINDEAKSEALFDAYRRVALSASPTIGPRIIALITAKLVADGRWASSTEERLLAAAELLSDAEFVEAKDWFDRYVRKLDRPKGTFFYDSGTAEDVASVDLWDGWGAWAAKLGQLGFITHSIRIIANREDHGELEPARLATDMYYDGAYQDLRELTDIATRGRNST